VWAIFFAIILSLLVFSLYANSLYNSFQLDDFIGWVPLAKNLQLPQDIGYIFEIGGVRVVTLLSFVLGYAWHGDWLPGYHLINIAIHAFASIGVFFLIKALYVLLAKKKQTSKNVAIYTALTSALLFATHPIQTQPVNYISQRLALFAGVFYVYSTLFYLHLRSSKLRTKRIVFGVLTAIFALLAFFSKENSFSLPILWLVIELFRVPVDTKKLVQKIGFGLAVSFFIVSLLYISRFGLDAVFSHKISPLGETVTSYNYLLTQVQVIPKYIQLLIFPSSLSIDYYFPVVVSVFSLHFLASLSILLFLVYFVFFFYKRDKVIGFGIVWFFITLVVESSFIPIADVIFEHRLYLPSVGFVFILAHVLSKLFSSTAKPWLVRAVFFLVILASYSFLTVQRNKVWSTQAIMWQDVVNKFPLSPRAHYNLGFAMASEQDFLGAMFHFEKTIELLPTHSKALNALGYLNAVYGENDLAVERLTRAAELEPENQLYRENLDIATIEKLRQENK